MGDYRDLEIWKRSMGLATAVYRLTDAFPAQERFVLVSQLRRAATSIPANIAEGTGRRGDKDFARFLDIAYGSLLEVETLILLAEELGFAGREPARALRDETAQLGRMLNRLRLRMRSHS